MSKKKKVTAVSGKKKWIPAVVILGIALAVVIAAVCIVRNKSIRDGSISNPSRYVTLGQYIGRKESLAVTQEDLQTEIDSVLEDHTEYEQQSGTVQDGDMVYADFEGYVNGAKIDATCGSDYVEIGSGDWLDGFESNLIGTQTRETAVFTLAVPDGTYGDASIDGQNVEFHVTVQYICGDEIKPEYNDAFVQSISDKYKTVEEYNAHLTKKLQKENEEAKAETVWSDVVADCKVKKYPKKMLEDAKEEVLQGYYDMADVYGCSKEEVFTSFGYDSEEAFIQSDLPSLAKDTAKEYLIAQAIAQKENIQYTQKEYVALLEEEYSYNEEAYDSKEAYEKAKKSYLNNQCLMKKVKEWIASNTEYTE